MIANLNAIKLWKRRLHFQIHRFNGFPTLGAASNVWLVRDDNQKEARGFQSRAAVRYILVKFELVEAGWRMRLSIPDHCPVENPIAIEKNCA